MNLGDGNSLDRVSESQNLGLKPHLNPTYINCPFEYHHVFILKDRKLAFLTCIQAHSCLGTRSRGQHSVHTEIHLPMCWSLTKYNKTKYSGVPAFEGLPSSKQIGSVNEPDKGQGLGGRWLL